MLMPGVGSSTTTCTLQRAIKVASLATVPALCHTLSQGQQEWRARIKTNCFQAGVDGTPGTSFHRRKLRKVEILAAGLNLLYWICTVSLIWFPQNTRTFLKSLFYQTKACKPEIQVWTSKILHPFIYTKYHSVDKYRPWQKSFFHSSTTVRADPLLGGCGFAGLGGWGPTSISQDFRLSRSLLLGHQQTKAFTSSFHESLAFLLEDATAPLQK